MKEGFGFFSVLLPLAMTINLKLAAALLAGPFQEISQAFFKVPRLK